MVVPLVCYGSINGENKGTHPVYQMLWEYITFGANFLIEEVIDIMSPTKIHYECLLILVMLS